MLSLGRSGILAQQQCLGQLYVCHMNLMSTCFIVDGVVIYFMAVYNCSPPMSHSPLVLGNATISCIQDLFNFFDTKQNKILIAKRKA